MLFPLEFGHFSQPQALCMYCLLPCSRMCFQLNKVSYSRPHKLSSLPDVCGLHDFYNSTHTGPLYCALDIDNTLVYMS